MLENIYSFKITEDTIIEKILDDPNLAINHIVLKPEEKLPEHNANSNVYLVILKGLLTIKLDLQEQAEYSAGNIINIPYGARMNITNKSHHILEFLVVKAPNPKNYGGN